MNEEPMTAHKLSGFFILIFMAVTRPGRQVAAMQGETWTRFSRLICGFPLAFLAFARHLLLLHFGGLKP